MLIGGIYLGENYYLYAASVAMFGLAAYRLFVLDKSIRDRVTKIVVAGGGIISLQWSPKTNNFK